MIRSSSLARSTSAISSLTLLLLSGCPGGTVVDGQEPAPAPSPSGEVTPLHWENLNDLTTGPVGRFGLQVADRGDQTAIVFGGSTIGEFDGDVFGDAWLLDATTDPPSFSSLPVTNAPAGRYCGCAAWDPTRRQVLLVGGRSFQDLYSETWRLNLDDNSFEQLQATPSPAAALGCALAYSANDDAFYTFGGASAADGMSDQLWRFDAATSTWAKISTPTPGPSKRYDPGLRALNGGTTLLLFAGADATNAPYDYKNDLWRFDVVEQSWTELFPIGPIPTARRIPWWHAEPGDQTLLMGFGEASADSDTGMLSDLWRLDLAALTWTELGIDEVDGGVSQPAHRGYAQWLPGGQGAFGLLLGGFDGSNPVDDAWRLYPASENPNYP